MKTAVLMLVVSTPAFPDADADGVAYNLRANAEVAEARARAIEALAANGWKIAQPFVMGDGREPGDVADYQDVVMYLRKDFATEDDASADARACGAVADLSFSLGWNDPGTTNDFGHPECETWGEP